MSQPDSASFSIFYFIFTLSIILSLILGTRISHAVLSCKTYPPSTSKTKQKSDSTTSPAPNSPALPPTYPPQPKQQQQQQQQQQHNYFLSVDHTQPPHASPTLSPSASLPMSRSESIRSLAPTEVGSRSVSPSHLSPGFTPPTTTPGTPVLGESAAGVLVDSDNLRQPKLLKELPEVNCIVRARIPTVTGTEVFLHLYQNNIDTKEHLAIVFGNTIRSTSLDALREGETEMDRMIRGAYTGRLYPGRTSSRFDDSLASSRENSRPPSAASNSLFGYTAAPPISAARIVNAPLVRIHSECYTGETAWSARCDCGEQLDEAARLMALDPRGGVVVYLRQEGRGIGLGEKLKAYNLQDLGNDTVQANLILRHPADARSYGLATAILGDLGLADIRLLTNNPDKIAAVEGPGKECKVVERVPMIPLAWKNMKGGVTGKEVGEYLRTKITQMGHLLSMPPE